MIDNRTVLWYNTGIKRWFSVQYRLGTAHQKPPKVIYGFRGFLIIRFGMRTLQAVSEVLVSVLLAQLAPSEARISISRTGHHYLHMSNTSAYAGIFFSKKDRRAARNELRAVCGS